MTLSPTFSNHNERGPKEEVLNVNQKEDSPSTPDSQHQPDINQDAKSEPIVKPELAYPETSTTNQKPEQAASKTAVLENATSLPGQAPEQIINSAIEEDVSGVDGAKRMSDEVSGLQNF